MAHEFIGRGLLITEGKTKILAVADLHMGYDGALRKAGVFVPGGGVFGQTMTDLKEIFEMVGKVDIVVLLGDVKHAFGTVLPDERWEILSLLDYLLEKSGEIVVVKGNHDVLLGPIVHERGVKIRDYWVWGSYCFLHGDRDFSAIYQRRIKKWVVGHAHPAIELMDGTKHERYKCFLCGFLWGREIIVVPSLFSKSEGVDVLTRELGLAWPLDVMRCCVYITNKNGDLLNFGLVKNIKQGIK